METKTSSGIATTYANPLLSIANTSLSKSSSTFEFICDDGSSEIDVHNEVFDNDVTQFDQVLETNGIHTESHTWKRNF
jgi:hypothetical protein